MVDPVVVARGEEMHEGLASHIWNLEEFGGSIGAAANAAAA
jgi:hypothetical protein